LAEWKGRQKKRGDVKKYVCLFLQEKETQLPKGGDCILIAQMPEEAEEKKLPGDIRRVSWRIKSDLGAERQLSPSEVNKTAVHRTRRKGYLVKKRRPCLETVEKEKAAAMRSRHESWGLSKKSPLHAGKPARAGISHERRTVPTRDGVKRTGSPSWMNNSAGNDNTDCHSFYFFGATRCKREGKKEQKFSVSRTCRHVPAIKKARRRKHPLFPVGGGCGVALGEAVVDNVRARRDAMPPAGTCS